MLKGYCLQTVAYFPAMLYFLLIDCFISFFGVAILNVFLNVKFSIYFSRPLLINMPIDIF